LDATFTLSSIGFLGVAACLAAYVYGYVVKPAGFRWLNILSLFSTTVALAQLTFVLQAGAPPGGSVNGIYALVFLLIAGLAQAWMAVKTRPDATRAPR
jgi:hypothetical protein